MNIDEIKKGEMIGNFYFESRIDPKTGSKLKYPKVLLKCSYCEQLFIGKIGHLYKSCGCMHRKLIGKSNSKHGQTYRELYPKEYSCWAALIQRCRNKNNRKYNRYGGRGIRVSKTWLRGFIPFINDMGKAPSKEYTLDRIDNDGDYTKENCRWTTYHIQNLNRSNTKLFVYNGEYKSLTDWGILYNISNKRLWSRINKLGMSLEDALFTPTILDPSCIKIKDLSSGIIYKSKKDAKIFLGVGEKKLNKMLLEGKEICIHQVPKFRYDILMGNHSELTV